MSNLKIITGHYGSGKTEFSVNYVMKKYTDYENTTLVDMDIVNPYFRSREHYQMFSEKNINLLGSSTGVQNLSADLPALPGEIYGCIENKQSLIVFDVGGDGNGAKVLSRFSNKISQRDYDMYCVVNTNRPFTNKSEKVIDYIYDIQYNSKLKITGLINNTHMLRETTAKDINSGYIICKEVENKLNIPLIHNIINTTINTNDLIFDENIFTLEQYFMRPEWL